MSDAGHRIGIHRRTCDDALAVNVRNIIPVAAGSEPSTRSDAGASQRFTGSVVIAFSFW
jgi:hypothetical protein